MLVSSRALLAEILPKDILDQIHFQESSAIVDPYNSDIILGYLENNHDVDPKELIKKIKAGYVACFNEKCVVFLGKPVCFQMAYSSNPITHESLNEALKKNQDLSKDLNYWKDLSAKLNDLNNSIKADFNTAQARFDNMNDINVALMMELAKLKESLNNSKELSIEYHRLLCNITKERDGWKSTSNVLDSRICTLTVERDELKKKLKDAPSRMIKAIDHLYRLNDA